MVKWDNHGTLLGYLTNVVKQCHKPPITENGNHTTYKNGDDCGMVYGIVFA